MIRLICQVVVVLAMLICSVRFSSPRPSTFRHRAEERPRKDEKTGARSKIAKTKKTRCSSSEDRRVGESVITEEDLGHLVHAAQSSLASWGETLPHPNVACVLVDKYGGVRATSSLWAQGSTPPEVAAVEEALAEGEGGMEGGTAYLNLETGDCHGNDAAIQSLVKSGVRRVVIGLKHPLTSLRNQTVQALTSQGIDVAVLGENRCDAEDGAVETALSAMAQANEALLHRAALGRPLGVLKYAMTLDGKIAASSGHSAWVSSKDSRQIVFDTRSMSDAVIVGGQTVRRDNPRLTTRRAGGHQPVRLVMSRTLDLPENSAVWDVSHAPTIVATQKGARRDFQRALRSRGVEVLEFDFLTPDSVADYCYRRGFLSLLWECGGTLAAPAIAGGAVHKVMAFVAPKIIGGSRAPTPVGDLGFVEMTQAVPVSEATWKQVGPDLMITGYLPKSKSPRSLAESLGLFPLYCHRNSSMSVQLKSAGSSSLSSTSTLRKNGSNNGHRAEFYKTWDSWGVFSNFSPHPVEMPPGPMTHRGLESFRPKIKEEKEKFDGPQSSSHPNRLWPSTEHYYQAQKFAGVAHPDALALVEKIFNATSSEEAALLGRKNERERPELVREDWDQSKTAAMHAALRAKFTAHAGPRMLLLSTATPKTNIVEAAPHDYFWGTGMDGSGQNMMGKLLMMVRDELLADQNRSRN